MSRPRRVYVAGPVGKNDDGRLDRVRAAMDVAAEIIKAGDHPFVPHLFHYLDERHPAGYEEWMRQCFAWLDVCEALVRLPGHSPGADREVARARELGIPVFHAVADVIAWGAR